MFAFTWLKRSTQGLRQPIPLQNCLPTALIGVEIGPAPGFFAGGVDFHPLFRPHDPNQCSFPRHLAASDTGALGDMLWLLHVDQ
jgi:hypothetical protein